MAYQGQGCCDYRDFGGRGYEGYWWRNLEQEETDVAALYVFTGTIILLMSFNVEEES